MTKKKAAKVPVSYKVYNEVLDQVVVIKSLTMKEEQKLFNYILKTVQGYKDVTNEAIVFKQQLIQDLILEPETILKTIATKDELEQPNYIHEYYACIAAIYPAFSLENICKYINTLTFISLNPDKANKFNKSSVGLIPGKTSVISNLVDIISLEYELKSKIIGQNDAIDSVVNLVKIIAAGFSKKGTLFFVGPTGVGKSQTAKILGERYSGNFFKVNCAEYSSQHEYAKLIGAPPGFVGFTEKSILAEKSEKSNKWVFLFDEIEKAHHKLYDFLLSVLDDGTCTDNLGKVLDFSESIFIFTSNKGVDELNKTPLGFVDASVTYEGNVLIDQIKTHFSPEFLNRVDEVVVFNSLTMDNITKIAEIELSNFPIEPTEEVINFIREKGYSKEYGARHIQRFIKKQFLPQLATARLNGIAPVLPSDKYTFLIEESVPKISLPSLSISV